MKLAKKLLCSKIIVESDCSQAIRFVSKKSRSWSDVEATVEEIWGSMSDFDEVQFTYIPRRRNRITDAIAKEVKLSSLNDVWVDSFPEVKSLVLYDSRYLAPVAF